MTLICSFCENEAMFHFGNPKTINFCKEHSRWMDDKELRQRGMDQIFAWCNQGVTGQAKEIYSQ